MATFTTRLGLTKPAGSEARSVTPLNTNADLIDKFAGCILVNDGVTPPTGDLFDGAIVKEKTSGIIWEARKNGGGTFDKVYINYPFQIKASRAGTTSTSTGTSYAALGYDTFVEGKNSSAANLVATRFVVPIKGIYSITYSGQFSANATGMRGLTHEVNSVSVGHQQDLRNASATFETTNWLHIEQQYPAGTTLCGARWQNSGVNINTQEWYFYAVLVEPVQ